MMKTLFTTLALAALNAGAQTPAAPRIRDSAGVRIVEHATIKTVAVAFTIDPKPTLDLGGIKDDPKSELDSHGPFLSAKRLSDGRIVEVDNNTFKLFDAKGKFIRNIGGRGQGPGEYNQVLNVCVAPGDTLVGLGYGSPRFSVFDTTGRHIRTVTFDGIAWTDPCFSDGSVLVRSRTMVNPDTRLPADRAQTLDRVFTATQYAKDGTPKTIGVFGAGVERMTMTTHANAVARGDAVYAGDGQAASIAIYSRSGTLSQIIRWNDPRVPVTDDMLTARLAMEPMGGGGASFREQVRMSPHVEVVPAYDFMKVDARGQIWLQDYTTKRGEIAGWTVIDSAGRLLGRVQLPVIPSADPQRRVDLRDIGADYVVLNWFDTGDGAQHVSFHALLRSK